MVFRIVIPGSPCGRPGMTAKISPCCPHHCFAPLAMTAISEAQCYPRPTNGILLAITVMNSTLASSGRFAM
jgi:hypothetical protein